MLGSWTVEGNLSKGPIGGDGISIAGGSAEAQVTISNNEFERIDGNGISAQDALGSWTDRGQPVTRTDRRARHAFSQPKRRRRHDQQHGHRRRWRHGAAKGIVIVRGSAAWSVTHNTISGTVGTGPQLGLGFGVWRREQALP